MKAKIIEILSGIRPDIDFTDVKDLFSEGQLDSLDIISLISEIEMKFEIVIDSNEIIPENFKNTSSIETLINSKK